MPCSRFVLRLLECAETRGVREEIIGDLLEESARGRLCGWICRQLLALCGSLLLDRLRSVRVTAPAIAVALSVCFMAGLRVTSAARLLEAWLVFYYLSGMLSLFAHMTSAGGELFGARRSLTAAQGSSERLGTSG